MAKKATLLAHFEKFLNRADAAYARKTQLQAVQDAVDAIEVPEKVSDLENDSKFQTETDVATAIASAQAADGKAQFEVADAVPSAEDAQENVLYLVMNDATGHYDIYALVSGEVVQLDDTTVDLTNYVEKVEGKGLSTNDYTTEDKDKLASIEFATDDEVDALLDGVFGAQA